MNAGWKVQNIPRLLSSFPFKQIVVNDVIVITPIDLFFIEKTYISLPLLLCGVIHALRAISCLQAFICLKSHRI
jgi:hypothetical protein